MLNKLKNTLTNIRDQDKEADPARKKIQIQVLSSDQVKKYRDVLAKFKENVQELEDLGKANIQGLKGYIQQRAKLASEARDKQTQPSGEDSESGQEKYTFGDDIQDIKDILKDLDQEIKEILAFQKSILAKVLVIEESEVSQNSNMKGNQELLIKYETENNNLKKSQENNKQILSTLKQQSQLYLKQMKDLQEKCAKLQKQLNQKNVIIGNLKQEKIVLLQMSNSNSTGQIPEVQALKNKLAEFQKRVALEKTKVEQKQKQIEGLKKRMEEDRESLQKIADELKQKQLKSKKFIDKYERSKTEIRKFREQKTQFIKQLNLQVAKMSQELSEEKKKNFKLVQQITILKDQVQSLKSEVSRNENRKIQLESNQSELIQLRKQLHQNNLQQQHQLAEFNKLKQANEQLQQKRKQLLEALQKPINHQIRTLQKILKALDKLYKDYITVVFQEGNIVGFESRITYIISNVQDIKEDLMI